MQKKALGFVSVLQSKVLQVRQVTEDNRTPRNNRCTAVGQALPPVSSSNGNPPAFDLAKLRVSHINTQGQTGHPYTHLQLGTQKTICKVEHYPTFPSGFLPIQIYIAAAL